MNSAELKQEISKWETNLQAVQASHEARSKQLAALEGQRRDHIVPARVEGNVTSLKELRRLDAEMSTVRRDVQDDAHAITEITNKLALLKPALTLADRLIEGERLRQFIIENRQRNRGARIVEHVRGLEAELKSWSADKAAVACALNSFDSRFGPEAAAIASSYREPARVEYGAQQHLQNFAAGAPKIYDAALAAIEQFLESEGSPAAPAEAAVARDPQPPAGATAKRQIFV